jgi:hypothetical protein
MAEPERYKLLQEIPMRIIKLRKACSAKGSLKHRAACAVY